MAYKEAPDDYKETTMIIVGIDPGKDGAVAVLPIYSIKDTIAIPVAKNRITDVILYLSEIRGGEPGGRLERAHHIHGEEGHHTNISRVRPPYQTIKEINSLLGDEKNLDQSVEIYLEEPGQIVVPAHGKDKTKALLAGMSSSRKLGRSLGMWEGIAASLNMPVTYIGPQKWQNAMGCRSKGNKNITKNLAAKLFPRLNITHAIADALLIAAYGYLQYVENKYIPTEFRDNISIPIDKNKKRLLPAEITGTTAPAKLTRVHVDPQVGDKKRYKKIPKYRQMSSTTKKAPSKITKKGQRTPNKR